MTNKRLHTAGYIRIVLIFICFLFSLAAKAQVTANFAASDTSLCAPGIVFFTNTSIGATSYSWDLGNGVLSSGTDASTSYTSVGTYTVTLVATNGTVSDTKKIIVRAYGPPTISFSASTTIACLKSPVTFTSTSTANSWGTLEYTWNFGDGASSTLATANYAYAVPGYYNITLLARNKGKCAASLTKGTYINVLPAITASFDAPVTQICTAPGTIAFHNTTSGSTGMTYRWFFGDGATSTLPNPAHTYTATGEYNVKLIATDANGCTDSIVQYSFAIIGGPKAEFYSKSINCYNAVDTFIDTTPGPIVSRLWDLGDGHTETDYAINHYYITPALYYVKLTVSNGTCADSITKPHRISKPDGKRVLTRPCLPPNTLQFDATTSTPSIKVTWKFGDATYDSKYFGPQIIDTLDGIGYSMRVTYPFPHPYYNAMIMTDTVGCEVKITEVDTLFNLFGDLRESKSPATKLPRGCAPLQMNFNVAAKAEIWYPQPSNGNASVTIVPFNYPISICEWDFGDGSPVLTGTNASPGHIYTDTGVYMVHCKIITTNGCMSIDSIEVQVGAKQTGSYTSSPKHVCRFEKITYKSTSTSPFIDEYDWLFYDGGGEKRDSFEYTYLQSGIFAPDFYVLQNGCKSDVYNRPDHDTIDSPTSIINFRHTCIPNNGIAFSDSSMGDDTYLWDFGDGTTSTTKHPVHYYDSITAHTAYLFTFNAMSGCRDTASVIFNLEKMSHGSELTISDANICRDDASSVKAVLYAVLLPTTPPGLYTLARECTWYDNGVPTDTSLPYFPDIRSPGLQHDTIHHTYPVRGDHVITLVLLDSQGCLDTMKSTIVVAKPIAKFSIDIANGCAPIATTFVDSSTDVAGTQIKDYKWNFGDGMIITHIYPSITHNYKTSGTFRITEIVSDTTGCFDTAYGSVTTVVHNPVASFSVTDSVNCLNTIVGFRAIDLTGGATSWLWSFGDGTSSTLFRPTHKYATAGTYTISLVVADPFGCTDTVTKSNHMVILPTPVATFSMDDSFAICPPLSVNFSNFTTGAIAFQWSFGDGIFSVVANPNDIYSSPGYYTIKLVASNELGCIDTAIGHATVFGFKGAFSYTPVTGCIGDPVHFKALISGAASMAWDFNDGTTSSLMVADTISHIYPVTGKYMPKLILVDSSGCSSFSYGADTIKVDSLIPDFSFIPSVSCQNASVTFKDTSRSYFSSSSSWLWSFGSGATSTLSAPAYAFTVSGSMPVTLNVTNSTGCSGSITKNVTVTPGPSVISGNTTICAGLTSQLSNAATGGTWASSNTAVATIGTAGILTGVAKGTSVITYTLATGCSVTTTATVNAIPTAINGTAGMCTGATTTLSNATTGGTWTSSNTSVATIGTSGVVTGVAAGTVTISYTNALGCAATRNATIYPLPGPVKGTLQVCKGLTTTLSNTVAGGTWISSNTVVASIGSVTAIVNGLNTGTALITYKLATGCIATATVTVDPQPNAITGTAKACVGATATLSNSGSSGGTWTSGNTAIATIDQTTGTFTGVAAGTATISYTIATGCLSSKTVTISLAPATITGPVNVCIANTIALSNSVAGGTWTSSNTSIATITSAAIVTGKAAGTSVITYTLSTGCLTQASITVTPAPSAITGTTQVCSGLTQTLSNSLTGGSWTSSNTAVAIIGAASGMYTGTGAGTATITYTPGSGCTAVTTVSVIIQPGLIKGRMEVCPGLSVTLSDFVTGGMWSTAATLLSVGSTSGIVTGNSAGTATVTYTLANTCNVAAIVTVNPLPDPITGNTHACEGATGILSDAITGGSWTSSNTTVATIGSMTGIFSGISAGTATVTYTLPTGCLITTTVTTNAPPNAISGTKSVCAGLSTTLSSSGTGGIWVSTNTTVATIGSMTGIITGILAGTATISFTLPTGCFATTTATVLPLPAAISGTTFAACTGNSILLSDADGGGTWASGNTTVAIVSPPAGTVITVAPGTAVITYTLPTGCITTVTVTAHPNPVAITGPLEVCEGLSIILSDATTGGSWTSGNTAIAVIDPGSGLLTGVTAGTAAITYTLGTNCLTTTTVIVNPTPAAISGATDVCLGYTTALSDATLYGTWSEAATAISVATTGVVTGLATGTGVITYTLPTGCITTATVTVNPLPDYITGIVNICMGASTALASTTPGGTWSTTDTAVVIDPVSGIATGVRPVTGMVTYTAPGGCYITTMITVNDTPSAITGIAHLCMGSVTKLSEALPVGTWNSDNTTVAIVDGTGGVSAVSPGTATISFTGTGRCMAFVTVTVYPVIAPIKGVTAVCPGMSVALSDAITGGVWASSNTAVATVGSTGSVTGIIPGTVTISYYSTAACDTAVLRMSVNPLPYAGIIRGERTLCTGVPVQLTDSIAGGIWSSGNSAVAVVSINGTVTGKMSGTDTIYYSYTNSCGTAKAFVTVTVAPTPEYVHITTHPDTILCDNTLFRNFGAQAPPQTGMQYIWSATNAVVYATGSDKQYCLVNFNEPGTSVVRLKTNTKNTGCATYDSIICQVSAAEQEYPVVVYYAPEFVCKDNTAGSFQWGYDDVISLDSTLLKGMVNQNYNEPNPDFAHRHYWVITTHEGCMYKSYYNKPMGVQGAQATNSIELLLYPNPADRLITITVKGAEKTAILEARIVDIMGRERKTAVLSNTTATINVSSMVPGMYIVQFYANGVNIGNKPFVKE